MQAAPEAEPDAEDLKRLLHAWDQSRRSGPKGRGLRKPGKVLKNLKRAPEDEAPAEVPSRPVFSLP